MTLGAWRGVALSMLAGLGLVGCSTFAEAQTPAGRAGIPSHTRLLAPITKAHGVPREPPIADVRPRLSTLAPRR